MAVGNEGKKFCTNCGAQIDANAKFCNECGAQNNSQNRRKEEYVGTIKKCPSCGSEIPSFAIKCPACGHELNATTVSNSLQDFISEIELVDSRINFGSKQKNHGWSSWSSSQKTWWVILNIFFVCIPLMIYSIIPLLFPNKVPPLSIPEKEKVDFIENYTFPNDRESILAAMMFIKSKITFLANGSVDQYSLFWSRLWITKAKDLHLKSQMLLKGDTIEAHTFSEILQLESKIKQKALFRFFIGLGILIAFTVFVLANRKG